MSIQLDQIDQAFQSDIHNAKWLSPSSDDDFQTNSHYIIIEEEAAFKACRSVTGSESFDLKNPVDFKQYPPCKICSQQVINFNRQK